MQKRVLCFLFLCLCGATVSAFKVDPANARIVVPANAPGIVRFAAQELQRHLAMKTGKTIPIAAKAAAGQYTFLFERPADAKLKPEEAVWEVGKTQTRIYGDSNVGGVKINISRILNARSKTGDLTAVYAFLEQQLGFLFPAPGDRDTAFVKSRQLELTEGKFQWDPGRLVQREMRFDYGSFRTRPRRAKKSGLVLPYIFHQRVKAWP